MDEGYIPDNVGVSRQLFSKRCSPALPGILLLAYVAKCIGVWLCSKLCLRDDPSKRWVSRQPQLTVLPHAYREFGVFVYGWCSMYCYLVV